MPPLCLQCPDDAKRLARIRGLCNRCYARCGEDVRSGKTSWAALEGKGLARPGVPRGTRWRWFQVRPKQHGPGNNRRRPLSPDQ
jgi:hypothetical protein